ncbi:hypothetical protein Tco_0067844 [Tanacetum coccineum]
MFTNVRFKCLFKINKPVVPRFILDFYSQVKVQTDEYGYLLISFMIQHEFITLSLTQFDQILRIPYNGQAVFTNEWDLASLAYSQETEGPYHTDLPTLDDIRQFIHLECIVQLILFIVDSGCTKHMTGNLKLLCNFVEKHNSSSLGRQCQMASAKNNTSGPVPQCSKRRLITADQASVINV